MAPKQRHPVQNNATNGAAASLIVPGRPAAGVKAYVTAEPATMSPTPTNPINMRLSRGAKPTILA
jgi:hypothetical protein